MYMKASQFPGQCRRQWWSIGQHPTLPVPWLLPPPLLPLQSSPSTHRRKHLHVGNGNGKLGPRWKIGAKMENWAQDRKLGPRWKMGPIGKIGTKTENGPKMENWSIDGTNWALDGKLDPKLKIVLKNFVVRPGIYGQTYRKWDDMRQTENKMSINKMIMRLWW